MKCFLSAPSGIHTKVLRGVLSALGVSALDAYDLQPGELLGDGLRRLVAEADFLLAVVASTDENVYYEMGLATGLGKPVLALISAQSPASHVYNSVNVRVDLQDSTLLKVLLTEYVRRRGTELQADHAPSNVRSDTPPDSHRFASRYDAMWKTGTAQEIEGLVAGFLSNSGLIVEGGSSAKGFRADFAVISQGLESIIRGPLLVELKIGQLQGSRLIRSIEPLVQRLGAARAAGLIVLYVNRASGAPTIRETLAPLVLFWDLGEFIRDVGSVGFARALLIKRNNIAHGALQ